jgi:hypothetical protein
MKKLLVATAAVVAAVLMPAEARAIGQCGLPSTKPIWIDFGTPELGDVFGRRGVIMGASTGDFPAQMRARGAKTIYWDMNLNRRVGTPSAPEPAELIVERANRLFDFAAQQSGCDKPLIILNELFGANLETPWTASHAQYRSNVMTLLRTLAERGSRPYLLVPRLPYTQSDDAAAWWREASRLAYILPEVYFHAPTMWRIGAISANRRMRVAFRTAVRAYTTLGIPTERLGIVLGFQASRGFGGREGLEPDHAWFEVVKWQVLAAKQVARETGIGTIVSWGWASYRQTVHDADKKPTACVYLWTRDPGLCKGRAAAGRRFNASRTEGQLRLPAGVQCTIGRQRIRSGELATLQRITGDREVAYAALLARITEAQHARVPMQRVLAAERAVIAMRFGGSGARYRAALARAGANVAVARGVLGDELRRIEIERGLRARRPSASAVSTFYVSYPDLLTRSVRVDPAPWWLGGRKAGLAFDTLVPGRLFALPTGRKATLRGLEGAYAVTPLGPPVPLGLVPLAQARGSIASTLAAFEKREALERWSVARQERVVLQAICRGDELPLPGAVGLSAYLPFLGRV